VGSASTSQVLIANARTFYPLTPCRVVDTRLAPGPLGGPSISALSNRSFPIFGACGIPTDAHAVSVNVTAVNASVPGSLRIAGGATIPSSQSVSYHAVSARAANGVFGTFGNLIVKAEQASGTVDTIIDVNGYFK
jgi:hypothetical protein